MIDSLFRQTDDAVSNKELLTLLKNNETLKNLGDISLTIKELLSSIKDDENMGKLEKVLKTFSKDIKDIKTLDLKQNFQNSGIFLESKLKESTKDIKKLLENDLKANILKSNPQQIEVLKHIDKLALQIDYYQLMSHLSNGSTLFLPFSWDMLDSGEIEINKSKDNKFFCDINLKLKKFGELNLRLVLYEKNLLDIYIYSDNTEFKILAKDSLNSLRLNISDIDLQLKSIRFFEIKKKKKSPYNDLKDELKLGFRVKV